MCTGVGAVVRAWGCRVESEGAMKRFVVIFGLACACLFMLMACISGNVLFVPMAVFALVGLLPVMRM